MILRNNHGKEYKSWAKVKEGDFIYYYDKGKLRKQLVHSVEKKEQKSTFGYGQYTSVHKYILIKAGRGSNIKISEYYVDAPFYEDCYFTRFTSEEAAIDTLKEHLERITRRADRAKKKYERYKKISDNYNAVITKYEELINSIS